MDKDSEELIKYSAFSKLQKLRKQTVNSTTSTRYNPRNKPTPVKKQPKHEEGADENQLPFRQLLQVFDLKRQDDVSKALNERLTLFDEFSKTQQKQRKETWMKTQQGFIEDMAKQEIAIMQANEQYDLQNSSEHAKLVQHYQDAALRMKQKQAELQEKERHRRILKENIERLKRNQTQFRVEYEQIGDMLKYCPDKDQLRNIVGEELSLVQSIPGEMEALISSCKAGSVSEREVAKSADILNRIVNLKNRLNRANQEIVNKAEQVKEEAEKQKQLAKETAKMSENASNRVLDEEIEETDVNNLKITEYVNLGNLQMYTELMDYLKAYTDSIQQLEQDASMKQFRFDCKKAVNIPVNALSGANSHHILDKYQKLHGLLSGQNVIVSDRQVNASQHPQGVAFCKNLLAKKFVLQGDLIVSSNHRSAFCYASMIVTLWNDFPDFGKLLLAYFYKSCPYLVPYYIPKQIDETDEEYYIKLGYQYTDGQIEKQDKFLKRMTGIVRLYSAILVAKPKRGQSSSPHNLRNGWRWLACLLKLKPRMDITATALHVFLETIGYEMNEKYGQLFQKILRIIYEVFLPLCREAKCTGGAVTRLELLLNDYFKHKTFGYFGYIAHTDW
ncbi:mRNA export factor Gle1 [Cylas formicarius]|uniref:mRNA export factor Gle1 n=1 Tax=Cylas formicarius TaxID=197179 RepID=UPI0029588768|nr:mRNA export factor Gle1 [Cylas formicarius]